MLLAVISSDTLEDHLISGNLTHGYTDSIPCMKGGSLARSIISSPREHIVTHTSCLSIGCLGNWTDVSPYDWNPECEDAHYNAVIITAMEFIIALISVALFWALNI